MKRTSLLAFFLLGCPAGGPAASETDGGTDGGSDDGAPPATCNLDDGLFEGPWLRASRSSGCAVHEVAGEGVTFSGGGTSVTVDGVTLEGSFDDLECTGSYTGAGGSRTLELDTGWLANNSTARLTVNEEGCISEYVTRLIPQRDSEYPSSSGIGVAESLNQLSVAWAPRLHVADDGSAVVAFIESRGIANTWDLVARTYDPSTETFGPTIEVDDNADPLDGADIQLVGTDGGGALLAFVQEDVDSNNGGRPSLYANVFTPGAGFSGSVPLDHPNEDGLAIQGYRAGLADGPDGLVGGIMFGQSDALWFSRFDDGWWVPELVKDAPADAATMGSEILDVAVNEVGDIAATVLERGFAGGPVVSGTLSVWGNRVLDGGIWSPHQVRSFPQDSDTMEPTGLVKRAKVVALSDGRFLLVAGYKSKSTPAPLADPVFAYAFDGVELGPEIHVGDFLGEDYDDGEDIRVGATDDGGALVTWRYEGAGNKRQSMFSVYDGVDFTAPTRFSRDYRPEDISMSVNGSGAAVLVGGDGNDVSGDPAVGKASWLSSYDPATQTWTRQQALMPGRWGDQLEVGLDDSGGGLAIQRHVRPGQTGLFDLWAETLPLAPAVSPPPVGTLCVDRNFDRVCDPCDACVDRDGDGRGVGCSLGDDCDDADPTVFSGAPDLPGDGIDQDCAAGDPTLDDAAGIFVSSGASDANPGTRAQPVGTIAQGVSLAEAGGLPAVFVAAGTYAESPTSTVSLYGGYEATGWTRDIAANAATIDAATLGGVVQALDGFTVTSNVDIEASATSGQVVLVAHDAIGAAAPFQTAVRAFADAHAVVARSTLVSARWGVFADPGTSELFVVENVVDATTGLEPDVGASITATNNEFRIFGDRALEGSTGPGHQVLVGNVFDIQSSVDHDSSGIGCANGGSLVAVNNTVVIADNGRPNSAASALLCSIASVNNVIMPGEAFTDSIGVEVWETNATVHVWNNLFDPDGAVCMLDPQGCGTLYRLGRCVSEACISAGNNRSGDPMFVDPGAGDFHIGTGSSALGAALDPSDVCVELGADLDGDPRGASFDIGADERP